MLIDYVVVNFKQLQEELQVIREDNEFLSIKEYLNQELEKIENDTAGFLTIDQLDDEF